MNWRVSLLALGAVAAVQAQAQPQCRGETGKQATALVELFTSEGCDSCPPADKVMAQLKASDKAVPLAWHVDYWDRLGWKDPFARADAAVRQRQLVALQNSRSVYTPQWIASGITIQPGGQVQGVMQLVAQINRQTAPAWIALSVERITPGQFNVELDSEAPAGAQTYIALVEDGLSSQVSAGENKGVLLKHDHVVREVVGPLALSPNRQRQTYALRVPQQADLAKLRVVAWAQDASGKVLNAVAAQCSKG
jgi:hypothetical protein